MNSCYLNVKETGIYPMTPGDVGMVFWLLLVNPCPHQFHVNVKMIHCSETISDNDAETAAMYLIGGYMGIINAKSDMKATLIYPNMYLYNRQGSCTIGIFFTDEYHTTHTMRTRIKFSTAPEEGNVPVEVQKFYHGVRQKHCEAPDLDPLEKCLPVDCMMKYTGSRNYYNEKWKRCQKVPVCVSDGMRDEPDVSYVPTSNRCRNLASCISENDISILEEGVVSNNTFRVFSSRGLLLRCNHGRLNNNTGVCLCDEGYTSGESDIENYVPGLTVYHMCNIKIDSWNKANLPKLRRTILAFSILAVVITMVILLLTFCCYGIFVYYKSYDHLSPFGSSTGSSDDTDSVDFCEGAALHDTMMAINQRNK